MSFRVGPSQRRVIVDYVDEPTAQREKERGGKRRKEQAEGKRLTKVEEIIQKVYVYWKVQ